MAGLRFFRIALAGLLAGAATPALAAGPCREEAFEGTRYTVCSFDLAEADMRLFLGDASGRPYRTFAALADDLAARNLDLVFAMNGGMYEDDFSPVGLHVEGGRELSPANTRSVREKPEPNFYKKPNGVFYVAGGRAGILETSAFLKAKPPVDFATQSGPMLIIGGEIHPAFIVGSRDRNTRNGVGVSGPTTVDFAISEDDVNFHDFARFFRDRLGAKNALFLDGGSAPGLYEPGLGREDPPGHGGYGPIVAVVRPKG